MTNLNVIERRVGSVVVLDLEGRIRLGGEAAQLQKALRSLVDSGERAIILNLAGVSHIDSSGLGELVRGYATLRKAGGELKILNLSGRVHELMTMTKLLTVFDVFDSENDAVESFTGVSGNSSHANSLM